MTWMLLFIRNLELILIVSKFNLHNFDYLSFFFSSHDN
jgi:hypothetical protein